MLVVVFVVVGAVAVVVVVVVLMCLFNGEKDSIVWHGAAVVASQAWTNNTKRKRFFVGRFDACHLLI